MGGADWSRVIALTDEEFLAAWHALGLGDPPPDLGMSVPDTTVDAAVEYAIALDQLDHRGLLDGSVLGQGLVAALRALGQGSIRLDLRLSDGLIVLGAVDGDHGGLLVIDDAHDPGLYLLPMSGAGVAATLVELVLMRTDIVSGGQLEARSVVGGIVHPGRWALAFHRGSAGGHLQVSRPAGPGGTAITTAPITAEKLRALLDELVHSLRRA